MIRVNMAYNMMMPERELRLVKFEEVLEPEIDHCRELKENTSRENFCEDELLEQALPRLDDFIAIIENQNNANVEETTPTIEEDLVQNDSNPEELPEDLNNNDINSETEVSDVESFNNTEIVNGSENPAVLPDDSNIEPDNNEINTNNDEFENISEIGNEEELKINEDKNLCVENEIINSSRNIIDLDILFGEESELSAEELLNNLGYYELSGDENLASFADMLNNAFIKYDCSLTDEQVDLLTNVIELINNNTSSVLEKSTIEELNKGDCLGDLGNIINGDELYGRYMVESDSAIGEFEQGRKKDCWLLSALESLNSTQNGADLIKDAISWSAEDEEVSVYFAGEDVEVTLSVEEVIEAVESRQYSKGDVDALIIELAMEKVYGDINYDFANNFWKMFVDDISEVKRISVTDEKLKTKLDEILEKKEAGENFASTFCIKGEVQAQCLNGDEFYYNGGAHALAITDITKTTISFVNPWDTSQEYTLSWQEFENLDMYMLEYVYYA